MKKEGRPGVSSLKGKEEEELKQINRRSLSRNMWLEGEEEEEGVVVSR